MKNKYINIGIPSKGRLKQETILVFNKRKLNFSKDKRNLIGKIINQPKNLPEIRIVYLHARECIDQLSLNNLDLCFSGLDLLKESEVNVQKNIIIQKKLNFGKATLVLAIPDIWIDVQTLLDLDEVAEEFRKKKKRLLRIATKYPNLTRQFLYSKGLTQFELVKSLGSTEVAPYTGTAEIVSDITSSGSTLASNNLRVLKDGKILQSEACIFVNRQSFKSQSIKRIIKILSK